MLLDDGDIHGPHVPAAASERPWDFTELADTYDFRPHYDASIVHDTLDRLQLAHGDRAIDVGAGTGKLTSLLCGHGLDVIAVEPNARMRARGMANPAAQGARWIASRGETLPIVASSAAIVTFGSSFNVVQPRDALDECARVLRHGGAWFATYNHRDLHDPLQREIEAIIQRQIPAYDYGRRRRSPEPDVMAHGAFAAFASDSRRFIARVRADEWMLAWSSHATLQRQAGAHLPAVLMDIARAIGEAEVLEVPYTTHVWTATRR